MYRLPLHPIQIHMLVLLHRNHQVLLPVNRIELHPLCLLRLHAQKDLRPVFGLLGVKRRLHLDKRFDLLCFFFIFLLGVLELLL